jgi:hypothetical protein
MLIQMPSKEVNKIRKGGIASSCTYTIENAYIFKDMRTHILG